MPRKLVLSLLTLLTLVGLVLTAAPAQAARSPAVTAAAACAIDELHTPRAPLPRVQPMPPDIVAARFSVLVLQPVAAAGHVEHGEDGSGGEQHEIHGGHQFVS